MSDTPKRFEDWEQVDCNQCARYWDSSCDSVSEGKNRPCNSFLATRSVILPEEIKRLRNQINKALLCNILTAAALIIHILGDIFGA